MQHAPAEASTGDEQQQQQQQQQLEEETHRPEKRQKLKDEQQQDAPPAAAPPAAQLQQALARIANHIASASKFPKASQLLRQVLDAVDRERRDDLFAAVSAAFTHPQHATDPLLRKDYVKLLKAVQLRDELFSKRQQAQLEVYATWALLQNELFTDDSFAFNKVAARIKAAIAALPDGDEEQEAAWAALFPQQAAELGLGAAAAAAAAAPSAQQQPEGAAEADPFGLDSLLAEAEAKASAAPAAAAGGSSAEQQPQPQQQQQPARPKPLWDAVSCLVMHKQALLDCLETAKAHQHKLAWARTGVELMIEEAAKPAAQGGSAAKFVGGQKAALAALMQFVSAERAARRSGVARRGGGAGDKAAKNGDSYSTSFERAQAKWGEASWVSARGKVGGQGDGSGANYNWLG